MSGLLLCPRAVLRRMRQVSFITATDDSVVASTLHLILQQVLRNRRGSENTPEVQSTQVRPISCSVSVYTITKITRLPLFAHRRRLKDLREPAYTIEESERAVGLGRDNGKDSMNAAINPKAGGEKSGGVAQGDAKMATEAA